MGIPFHINTTTHHNTTQHYTTQNNTFLFHALTSEGCFLNKKNIFLELNSLVSN